VVAVVVGERLGYAFRDPMMAALLDGLAEEIGAVGSSLLLVPVRSASGREAAEQLAALPMDAAVLVDCGFPARTLVAGLVARGTVTVGVDGPFGAGVPLVTIDDEGATAALVAHLGGLGHRDIGVVALPGGLGDPNAPDDPGDPDGGRSPGVPVRRTTAATAAISALPGGRPRCVTADWNTVEAGEQAADELLDRPDRPTAIIAQSDVLALGCLRAAGARGLAVPTDLSVAGFDGVDLHLLEGTLLTTVEQPCGTKGRTAAQLVLAALAGERPDDVRLPTALRVGTTTGPARELRPV
jgi:DNA-binding LacI/PurR family transcriptional regulator